MDCARVKKRPRVTITDVASSDAYVNASLAESRLLELNHSLMLLHLYLTQHNRPLE